MSTAFDVNSALLRRSKIGGLPAFGGRAGAADIAGDAPELAVERRRSSYSPFLLSPAIGQRAGELCEGEIGRRAAVEQRNFGAVPLLIPPHRRRCPLHPLFRQRREVHRSSAHPAVGTARLRLTPDRQGILLNLALCYDFDVQSTS